MKVAFFEVSTMPRLAGIALIGDRIPSQTTMLVFRHLLEQSDLGEQILEAVKENFNANRMPMKQGMIINATIITEPNFNSTKAMPVCAGEERIRSENGLIHSVETLDANVHDLIPAAEILHGADTVVCSDAHYQGF
jgi:IS5 family transposase